MDIKTKFNIGDTIVAIKEHKCIEFTITSIHTAASKNDDNTIFSYVTYFGKTTEGGEKFHTDERQCFTSREEFIAQL